MRAGRRSWAHPFLVCYACPAAERAGPTRIGIVVGKRVGNAVVRNRIKRRLREIVRGLAPRTVAGSDVVLIARAPAAAAPFATLTDAVVNTWKRARLLLELAPAAAVNSPGDRGTDV